MMALTVLLLLLLMACSDLDAMVTTMLEIAVSETQHGEPAGVVRISVAAADNHSRSLLLCLLQTAIVQTIRWRWPCDFAVRMIAVVRTKSIACVAKARMMSRMLMMMMVQAHGDPAESNQTIKTTSVCQSDRQHRFDSGSHLLLQWQRCSDAHAHRIGQDSRLRCELVIASDQVDIVGLELRY